MGTELKAKIDAVMKLKRRHEALISYKEICLKNKPIPIVKQDIQISSPCDKCDAIIQELSFKKMSFDEDSGTSSLEDINSKIADVEKQIDDCYADHFANS